ncbi:MAG: type II secretion system F family protein [bacterium]
MSFSFNQIDDYIQKIQKVPVTAKVFLLQNLSIMIKAGIPLAESLKTLTTQTSNKKLKMILTAVSDKINQGKNFGESLEDYKDDFDEMFINMIKSGEISGKLEETLKTLYLQTKKDYELKGKIKSAMIYPIIILCAMLGIGIFIMLFILPNLTKVFTDMNIELPLATKILIGTSSFLQNNGLLTLGIVIFSAVLITRLLKTASGKRTFDYLMIKTPILSPIITKINLARISRSLSSLIKTDINIINALEITSKVVTNSFYRNALIESVEFIKKGQKLESVFTSHPDIFPPIMQQMVAVGEETGSLDEILDTIAGFYEEEVSNTMNNLPTIIEPVLMLCMGGAIAIVALAVMMPMYSLANNF